MVPEVLKASDLQLLPEDWERVRFSDICKVRQGLQVLISDRLKVATDTSHEYITVQSINKTAQEREYIESPSSRVVCKPDDVLMTRTGNTGIVVTDVKGAFHNNFFLIDYDRTSISKTFLVEYLRSKRVQHVLLTKAGSSTIPDLNHSDFYSIEFPKPPLPEQRKIADILSTWDQAIEKTEALLSNARTQKRALMQQLLTGKRRFPAFEGQPWKEVRLGEICELVNGRGFKPHEWSDQGYPIIRIQNLNGSGDFNYFDGDFDKKIEVHDGDLLFAWSGSRGASFGPHIWNGPKAVLNYHTWRVIPNGQALQKFLHHYLRFITVKIEASAHGASALVHTQKREMEKWPCVIPSIEEQEIVGNTLTLADVEIDGLNSDIAKLRTEKKALMQQLLTGKRRVIA